MLAPWKKSSEQPTQHIKKQRHYFANKGPSSQGYGFSSSHVWMWELDCEESWVLKNYAFELWCWRRLLRVPWTARRSNHSILKEISPEYSILWPPDVKNWFIGKEPDAGKDWSRRRRAQQRRRWLDCITNSMDMSLSKLQELVIEGKPGVLQSMGSQRVRHDWATELNWTDGTGCHDLRFLNVEF